MYELISNFISGLASAASDIAADANYLVKSGIIQRYYRFAAEYSKVLLFFVPLGVIGAWRWSVWIIKRLISFFYRTPDGNYAGNLSIVTPVYNENPKYFLGALESWAESNPAEIIAVIDHSDAENIKVFKRFSKTFPRARLIVTEKPGKRAALADGILAAGSEIVALVDSDTVWSENIIPPLVAPFSDPEVGGVGPRQDVLQTRTLAQKLFKIRLDNRFLVEMKFLSAAGNALTCLSGRTAIYRREALLPHLSELVNEKFLGRNLVSGDDKTLTRLVQASGWKTKYIDDIVVYTQGFADMKTFLRQVLRWSRNSWRSDLKTLGSSWIWRREKALALHMADRFFPPFTMLLGPIYFFVSLFLGFWKATLALFIWWMVSRAVKIYPHLREKPSDIFLLPAYVVMTYVESMVKLYALVTVDEHDWRTRWDMARLNLMGPLKRAVSYLATFAIIFGAFFGVFTYKSAILGASEAEKQRKQEIKEAERVARLTIYTPDIPRVSAETLDRTKTDLIAQIQADPYGIYKVKPGDTAATLQSRYNLAANGRILSARTKTPIYGFGAGQQVVISVDNLRNPMSAAELRATDRFPRKPPRVTYDPATNTIFVAQGGSLATLSKIKAALGPARASLLEETTPGEWILRANLYVGKNVTFFAAAPEVNYLKLKSDSQAAVWLRGQSASLLFEKTKVTSWDEEKNYFDTNDEDGRAFVTARADGRMDIIDSEMAYMGTAGVEKRGGPFGGSYGVSWKIDNGQIADDLLTGVVTGSKFHHNYFGIYTFGATGLLIRDNDFYENVQYGLDPHDDSNNFLVEGNRAYNNGNHGIIFSRRCFANIIRNNISYGNKLHGIMLDRASNNNLVEGNTVYGNVDGIAIYESNANVILDNEIRNNNRGIRLNAKSSENYFEGNEILQNERGAYAYDSSNRNIFRNNSIEKNIVGITLKEGASENILYDNFVQFSNMRDGWITGDAIGNDIK
jgi:hyaluronan synthase